MAKASSSYFRLTLIVLAGLALTASAYGNAIFTAFQTDPNLLGEENVPFNTSQTGTMIDGFAGPTKVQFSSPTTLTASAGSNAFSAVNADVGAVINSLTITLPLGDTFGDFIVGMHKVPPPTIEFNVVATMSDGTTRTSQDFRFTGNTTTFLTVTTTGGAKITKLTFNSPSTGFSTLSNIRISDIEPIPEPSSMLLLGSGVLVFAQVLRRKLS